MGCTRTRYSKRSILFESPSFCLIKPSFFFLFGEFGKKRQRKKMPFCGYHFGVPSGLIWIVHIVIGAVLIYSGYMSVKDRPIPDGFAFFNVVLVFQFIFYHVNLLFLAF